MTFYHVVFLIFFIAPISTFIHELGHGIGSKLIGAEKIDVTIGYGKPLFSFSVHSIHIHIRRIFFIGGWTKGFRKEGYSNWESLCIAISGPLFNILFASLCFIALSVQSYIFMELFFWFNIWLAAVNLIPFQISNKYTDGYSIYRIFSNKK